MNRSYFSLRGSLLAPLVIPLLLVSGCTEYNSNPSCNPACDASACMVCQDGECVSTCWAEQRCEDGACLDIPDCDPACDANACLVCQDEACVSACSADQRCEDGACRDIPDCDPTCDASVCQVCQDGACVSACSAGQRCEDGACQDIPDCDPICLPGSCMVCQEGECVSTCSVDQYCENGACLDFPDCDPACDASVCMVCQEGECVSTCLADQRCEDGTCLDIPDCDPACDASACLICQAEGCVSACSDNQDCDNGICRDIINCDPACDSNACKACYYGECVDTCFNGQVCEAGTCLYSSGLQMGEICADDSACGSGRCLKYAGDMMGYCTSTGCQYDESCVNHAEGETAAMCCVEVDATYFICLKTADGYACGDQTGTCGTSCTGTLESACALGFPCLRSSNSDPEAICSSSCNMQTDCDDCSWTQDHNHRIECVVIPGGASYCLPVDIIRCHTWMDCPASETCTVFTSADQTALSGVCDTYGAQPPGSECDESQNPWQLSFEDRCSALYCLGGRCTEVCIVDIDCPEGMQCVEFTLEGVDDSIDVCQGI